MTRAATTTTTTMAVLVAVVAAVFLVTSAAAGSDARCQQLGGACQWTNIEPCAAGHKAKRNQCLSQSSGNYLCCVPEAAATEHHDAASASSSTTTTTTTTTTSTGDERIDGERNPVVGAPVDEFGHWPEEVANAGGALEGGDGAGDDWAIDSPLEEGEDPAMAIFDDLGADMNEEAWLAEFDKADLEPVDAELAAAGGCNEEMCALTFSPEPEPASDDYAAIADGVIADDEMSPEFAEDKMLWLELGLEAGGMGDDDFLAAFEDADEAAELHHDAGDPANQAEYGLGDDAFEHLDEMGAAASTPYDLDMTTADGLECPPDVEGGCAAVPGYTDHLDDAAQLMDEEQYANEFFGVEPLPADEYPPEPAYFGLEGKYWLTAEFKSKLDATSDAWKVCDAMKGWGTNDESLEAVFFSPDRSYEYLLEVKAAFEKKTKCANGQTLEQWLAADTACAFKEKLLSTLKDHDTKLELDREAVNVQFQADMKKKGKTVGDAHRVDKQMSLLSPRDEEHVLLSCGKGIVSGLKDSVQGYWELAKMGWKAMSKLATDPIGAVAATGCALHGAWRWISKKSKQAGKWVGKQWNKLWTDLEAGAKALAAQPCTSVVPLYCLFKKALTGYGQLWAYVINRAVSAVTYVFQQLIGKYWSKLSTAKRTHMVCWVIGLATFEIVLAVFAPFVFALIAKKIAWASSKVMKVLTPLLKPLGVTDDALKATLVGRWTSNTMAKVTAEKAAKLSKKADKANDALRVKTAKYGKVGKNGAVKKGVFGRNQRKINKAAKKHTKANQKALDAQRVAQRYADDVQVGMRKLAARDRSLVTKLVRQADSLAGPIKNAEILVAQQKKAVSLLKKAGASGKDLSRAELALAQHQATLTKLTARKATLVERATVMNKHLASSGTKVLDAAARKAMFAEAKAAAKSVAGKGVLARQTAAMGRLVKYVGRRVVRSPFSKNLGKTLARWGERAQGVFKAATTRMQTWAAKFPKLKPTGPAIKYNSKLGRWVEKGSNKMVKTPKSLGKRLYYRRIDPLLTKGHLVLEAAGKKVAGAVDNVVAAGKTAGTKVSNAGTTVAKTSGKAATGVRAAFDDVVVRIGKVQARGAEIWRNQVTARYVKLKMKLMSATTRRARGRALKVFEKTKAYRTATRKAQGQAQKALNKATAELAELQAKKSVTNLPRRKMMEMRVKRLTKRLETAKSSAASATKAHKSAANNLRIANGGVNNVAKRSAKVRMCAADGIARAVTKRSLHMSKNCLLGPLLSMTALSASQRRASKTGGADADAAWDDKWDAPIDGEAAGINVAAEEHPDGWDNWAGEMDDAVAGDKTSEIAKLDNDADWEKEFAAFDDMENAGNPGNPDATN